MSDTTDLIFVAGASRSGTTMIARVLGLHDKIHTMGETHYFGEIAAFSPFAPTLSSDRARQMMAKLLAGQIHGVFQNSVGEENYRLDAEILLNHEVTSPAVLFEVFAQYTAEIYGKQIPVEQTPRNIFYARALLELYPNSRFIEIVRDPRAVLYSQRKRWKIRFSSGPDTPLIQSLRVLVNYHAITMSGLWVSAIKSGLNLKEHSRFMCIHYEEIVKEPEYNLRKLCSFLGVDFHEKMLQAPHATSSTRVINRKKRGFYRSSLNEWNEKLPQGDRSLCELITSRTAAQLGYDLSNDRKHVLPVFLHMLRYPFHVIGMILLNPKRLVVQIRSVFKVQI